MNTTKEHCTLEDRLRSILEFHENCRTPTCDLQGDIRGLLRGERARATTDREELVALRRDITIVLDLVRDVAGKTFLTERALQMAVAATFTGDGTGQEDAPMEYVRDEVNFWLAQAAAERSNK